MFTLLSPKKKQTEFEQDPNLPELVNVDLDSIRSRGKLIILTENSSSTYYLYKEEPKGFDYELALFIEHSHAVADSDIFEG